VKAATPPALSLEASTGSGWLSTVAVGAARRLGVSICPIAVAFGSLFGVGIVTAFVGKHSSGAGGSARSRRREAVGICGKSGNSGLVDDSAESLTV